ncbi:MAG TPA: AmmeMemoRadiSam system protein B [Usitatibacter sp.]|nr:AmmeMemoRadiSam system protein B [Usitatibacter sp.]
MNAVARPTPEEVRREMGTPSTPDVRGQRDTVGYAATPEAMAKVWELSAQGPMPESFGEKVAPGVLGVIGPHDDYIYTARVYREIFPLVTAKTVVMVGVFHRYRRFEARDQLVFDAYRAWSSPDGEIAVSPLRDELIAALPRGMAVKDNSAHDNEHSLEGIAYFMKHARPDLEIVPVIIPAASFERLSEMASHLADALAGAMKKRGWQLGRDVAIVVSADGTHYGDDFRFAPYGAGGREAFDHSVADDRKLMRETLGGLVSAEKAKAFYATVVDPANPDQYRRTWCGRFSVTLGTLLMGETAKRMGIGTPRTVPVALGVSVDAPELAVRDVGVAPTAPANLYHFVMHPALAFVSPNGAAHE